MICRLDRPTENGINPVTGCGYDGSWILLALTDSLDYKQMCGSRGGVYTIKTSRRQHPNWKMAVGDLMGFCEANGKNAILVMGEAELEAVKRAYAGHSYNEPFLREDETPVLVHSTGMDSWEQIKRDGMLKSWNILKAEGAVAEELPIGEQLGDPADFRDYIMFGGGVTGEIVVRSKQQGKIVMDADGGYLTGARLYFDAKRMARDGLLVRDGCHVKVKDRLPLEPYLIWSATWETAGLESQTSTPKIFAGQADRRFGSILEAWRRGETGRNL